MTHTQAYSSSFSLVNTHNYKLFHWNTSAVAHIYIHTHKHTHFFPLPQYLFTHMNTRSSFFLYSHSLWPNNFCFHVLSVRLFLSLSHYGSTSLSASFILSLFSLILSLLSLILSLFSFILSLSVTQYVLYYFYYIFFCSHSVSFILYFFIFSLIPFLSHFIFYLSVTLFHFLSQSLSFYLSLFKSCILHVSFIASLFIYYTLHSPTLSLYIPS